MERITLNIIPKGITPVCHASQFDIGRVIRCDIMDDLQGYVFSDETVELRVCKPDNNIVTASVDVVSGDTFVLIETTEQMTACDGVNKCELRIMKGDVRIGSLNFDMKVEVDPLKDGVESETVIHNLESMVDEMVAEEVATQYDSSNVIFDNAPTSGHGTPYTVTSEGIKTAIDNAFDYDNTASGSIVHIEDGADNIPVKSLVSQIVAVESGSGEKSPTNPYTISGFDSGIVTRCGKNLVPETYVRRIGYTQPTATINNGVITFTDYSAGGRFVAYNVKTNIGTKYTIKFASGTSLTQVGYIESDTEPTEWLGFKNTLTANTPKTITATKEWLQIYIEISANNATLNYLQVEVGDTATTFEAYNGNTYNFAFGQTVYGGHFDNKGNLVVTHIFGELVAKTKNGNYFRATLSDLGLPNIYDRNADLLCDRYAVADVTTTTSNNNQITVYGDVGDAYAIRWVDLNYLNANVSTYNTAMASNKPKICYKLLNPITLAITSQDIPTLLGENNIFSNCGDVEVNYYTSKSNDILDFINSEIDKKNGDNIPIEENSQDSIKDYVDDEISSTKDYVDNGLNGKADSTDLPFVKYEEIDVALDSTGEGTLFATNKYVVGIKDIPSDSLYVGYAVYFAGTQTKCKAISRQSVGFTSQSIVSTTRNIGVYYIDNIATQ